MPKVVRYLSKWAQLNTRDKVWRPLLINETIAFLVLLLLLLIGCFSQRGKHWISRKRRRRYWIIDQSPMGAALRVRFPAAELCWLRKITRQIEIYWARLPVEREYEFVCMCMCTSPCPSLKERYDAITRRMDPESNIITMIIISRILVYFCLFHCSAFISCVDHELLSLLYHYSLPVSWPHICLKYANQRVDYFISTCFFSYSSKVVRYFNSAQLDKWNLVVLSQQVEHNQDLAQSSRWLTKELNKAFKVLIS